MNLYSAPLGLRKNNLIKVLGPPAFGGRYVTGLAVRSALRFFRFAQKARSGLRPPLHIARPSALWALAGACPR